MYKGWDETLFVVSIRITIFKWRYDTYHDILFGHYIGMMNLKAMTLLTKKNSLFIIIHIIHNTFITNQAFIIPVFNLK